MLEKPYINCLPTFRYTPQINLILVVSICACHDIIIDRAHVICSHDLGKERSSKAREVWCTAGCLLMYVGKLLVSAIKNIASKVVVGY